MASTFKTKEQYAADKQRVIFHIMTKVGPVRISKTISAEEIAGILKKYNTEGVFNNTAKGLTWFPSGAIDRVDVEIVQETQ